MQQNLHYLPDLQHTRHATLINTPFLGSALCVCVWLSAPVNGGQTFANTEQLCTAVPQKANLISIATQQHRTVLLIWLPPLEY